MHVLSPSRPSVLILDDYPDAAEAVALLLELAGWRAVWVDRIDTATEILRCERFDALIMEPHLAAGEASQVAIAARRPPPAVEDDLDLAHRQHSQRRRDELRADAL